MGVLADVIEVLIVELGDGGLQAIAILEDIITDIDTAAQFPAIISVGIVLALFICLIVCWGASDNR
jgi:hypothetical protein